MWSVDALEVHLAGVSVRGGVALLFPGQGTLRPGTAHDLYGVYPRVRASVDLASSLSGLPLADLIARGPASHLAATDVAQVAVVAAGIGLLRHLEDQGVSPSLVMGHSAGEITALAAAGVLDDESALRLVVARGRAMAGAGRIRAGAMIAVTGLAAETVELLCSASGNGHGVAVVAAHNSPVQTVVAGDVAAVERVAEAARRARALRVDTLAVGGAFHSPLMAAAQPQFAQALHDLSLRPPRCMLVSSITGAVVDDVERHRGALVEQLVAPVRWVEAMATARRLGAVRFAEVGPGRVLSALARRCDASFDVAALGDVKSCERFLAAQPPLCAVGSENTRSMSR